jgi:hypothetical protein
MVTPYRPINVYLATQGETTFDPGHMATRDLDVLTWDLTHEEGQIPTLELILRRPGWPGQSTGPNAPEMPTWIWFSYNPSPDSVFYPGPVPLFYGIRIAIPGGTNKETVRLRYQSRSVNFIRNKQAEAEALKVLGPWDPVTISGQKKDDPDTVLEGWSRVYHFSRLPTNGDFVTSSSDIIDGEDGTVVFDPTGMIYNTFDMEPGDAPLTNIQVQMRTKWTQRTFGFIATPDVNLQSYTGQSFMDQWFKPNQSIGGGWSCESSFVWDVFGTAYCATYERHFHYVNTSVPDPDWPQPNCAVSEVTSAITQVTGGIGGPTIYTSVAWQEGICAPLGVFVDVAGRPITVNIPSTLNKSGVEVMNWQLNCSATLRYDPKRDYTETAIFNMVANLQPVLTAPTVEQNTELLTIDCVDVGEQLVDLEPWTSFAGQSVPIATMIWPNNPTTPGGLSFQVCVVPGIAGNVEPVFYDIPGAITIDGTVHWASMGTNPLTSFPGWSPNSPIGFGQIMCYEPVEFDINRGTFEPTGQTVYYLCTGPGTTNGTYQTIEWYQPRPTSDIAVVLRQIVPYIPGPAYAPTPGSIVSDGSVTWYSLGVSPAIIGIPIGGTPLNVTARNYFSTDRGQITLQNGMYRARARLRKRARAITIKWDTPLDNVVNLSCRMNAAIYDQRIYGGVAEGKITKYTMHGDGQGKLRGHVEIGIPVGLGGSQVPIGGEPTYVNPGYVQLGYQIYDGQRNANMEADFSYAPPTFQAFDDGLNFPLQNFPGTIVLSRFASEQAEFFPPLFFTVPVITVAGAQEAASAIALQEALNNLANNPTVGIVDLAPVTNGPFNGSYSIDVSLLEVNQGIDLGGHP